MFIYAGLLLLLIGYCINISDVSDGVKYFGTFLIVTGSYAAFPGVVAWYISVPLFGLRSLTSRVGSAITLLVNINVL